MRIQIPVLLTILVLSGCASKPSTQIGVVSTTRPDAVLGLDKIAELDNDSKLELVRGYLQDEDYNNSQLLLDQINFLQLDTRQQTQYGLLITELNIKTGNSLAALEWLSGPMSYVFDDLDIELQVIVSQWRSTAWEYRGQFLSAARERIFLSPILNEEQSAINQELIWADLQFIHVDDLLRLSNLNDGSELSGWASLAYTNISSGRDLELQFEAINQWVLDHPSHPAAVKLPGGLDLLTTLVAERPDHVGIMLPLSGPLKNSGEAIKNGFMAAYFQALTEGRTIPKVTFIDTDKVRNPVTAYKQLVATGAKLVIGPLEKKKVRSLQSSRQFHTPVLALNTSESSFDMNRNFFQFGLSPEDEATQAAHRASQLGYKRAAVLVPANSWGERIFNSFKSELNQSGGNVVSQVKYANTANRELLQVVRKLLNLDASIKRTAIIEQVISDDVKYEPRRRKDIDVIFIAATPSDARQLKPLLDFQYASDIPLIGTSTIYSGKKDPDLDKDIEGIQFLDMPWQIESNALKEQIYSVYGELNVMAYNRLFALGADAFQLHPRLRQLDQSQATRIHGYTGILSMNENGRIKRELSWAVIKRGIAIPVIIEDTPAL